MKNYEKYDLSKMKFGSYTTKDGTVQQYHVRYDSKVIYRKKPETPLCTYEILKDFANWLNSEVQILNEKEKEYLSVVIKPFRDDVIFIRKREGSRGKEYIAFSSPRNWLTGLPPFEEGTMYKGMELEKRYTPEELGL